MTWRPPPSFTLARISCNKATLQKRSSTSSTLTHSDWRTGPTSARLGTELGDIERDYGRTFQEALKDSASGPFYPPLDLAARPSKAV